MNSNIKIKLAVLFLTLCGNSLSAQAQTQNPQNHNQNKQCFVNAKHAYQYLLQQEKKAKQTAKARYLSNVINLNTATEAELVTLKGIGSKKAQDILLYREMIGKFNSVDEITNIKGIGKKTLAKNRARLTVE